MSLPHVQHTLWNYSVQSPSKQRQDTAFAVLTRTWVHKNRFPIVCLYFNSVPCSPNVAHFSKIVELKKRQDNRQIIPTAQIFTFKISGVSLSAVFIARASYEPIILQTQKTSKAKSCLSISPQRQKIRIVFLSRGVDEFTRTAHRFISNEYLSCNAK